MYQVVYYPKAKVVVDILSYQSANSAVTAEVSEYWVVNYIIDTSTDYRVKVFDNLQDAVTFAARLNIGVEDADIAVKIKDG